MLEFSRIATFFHIGSVQKYFRQPKLSVIINCYNMSRELPRTLKSLSPPIQKDVDPEDYEIIVVDNGSTEPFDKDYCKSIADNIYFLDVQKPLASPCSALNAGMTVARGRLWLVMIDGARMASPRLLRKSIDAAKLGKRSVIGTIAFHLGSEIQMQAVNNGYNQTAEDALLSSVAWEKDGYRLFDISVLAGSSLKGWFELPSETNAICMHKDTWRELDGYDVAFQAPGGGLANLDMWKRACNLPGSQVILLLGEATFHQFHGGIATNSTSIKSTLEEFNAEYKTVRGKNFSRPRVQFVTYGNLRQDMLNIGISNHTKTNSNNSVSEQRENGRPRNSLEPERDNLQVIGT
ncbi:MAG: glycosyltransferase [Pseudomonadota bacterium]